MTCPEYPKTDTLFTRGDDHVITDVIRRPEFYVPAMWIATEKIDGTNIRISLELSCKPSHKEQVVECEHGFNPENWGIVIRGRTSRAQIPTLLFEHLQKTFTVEKLKALWRCKSSCETCHGGLYAEVTADPDADWESTVCPGLEPYGITLYGEGYGGGINKGGGQYTSKTKGGAASFRLFDVFIGETWLDLDNIADIANKLGIQTVPLLGTGFSIPELVAMVREGFYSTVANEEGANDHPAEGIMAFTSPPLFNSRGKRLMFKLKTKDFAGEPSYTRTDFSPPVINTSPDATNLRGGSQAAFDEV